jgi:hypothetical protein
MRFEKCAIAANVESSFAAGTEQGHFLGGYGSLGKGFEDLRYFHFAEGTEERTRTLYAGELRRFKY